MIFVGSSGEVKVVVGLLWGRRGVKVLGFWFFFFKTKNMNKSQ